MRRLQALLVLALLSGAVARADQGNPFRHDWSFEDDGTRLVSNHRAPFPFSTSGEPEATLVMQVVRPSSDKPQSLTGIVQGELKSIREELKLADYQEADGHKPEKNVATWYEEVAGTRVAFIRYRVAGTAERMLPTPRTITHAIAVKGGYTLFFHLTVLFAAHQDEVRADQRKMMELVLPKFPPRR